MRTKRIEPATAVLFPAIAATRRVKLQAQQSEIDLSGGSGLRDVLRLILDELQEDEDKNKAAYLEAGGDPKKFRPLVKPAKELLGLTPTTEHKGIGDRQGAAAKSRGVEPSTMRKHEPKIARELAVYLGPLVRVSSDKPGVDVERSVSAPLINAAERLATRRFEPWPSTSNHSMTEETEAEISTLVSALADTYDELRTELDVIMYDTLEGQFYSTHTHYARSLLALVRRGFDRGIPISRELWERVRAFETPDFNSFLCLLSRLLVIVDRELPRFSDREKELLNYAANESSGNLHGFLSLMEQDSLGKKLLRDWDKWLFNDPEAIVFWDLGRRPMAVRRALYRAAQLNGGKDLTLDNLGNIEESVDVLEKAPARRANLAPQS